ncbi:MAG TPA: LacI family DNA-binding transcriptional regulator [Rhizobacter sp.]|nr:LacI family DNA-binding transcriptional regulator [Rhizobacter sp.]
MPRLPKPRTVSIRDVADLAGVSLGSASRVINKVENVGAGTREKVEAAIAQLGYRPNHAAQSLRLRSTRTIGCLLTDVSNPLYAKLYRALEERMRSAGYMMLLANGLNQPEREVEILSTFKTRGMDGLLIAPGGERDAQVLTTIRELGIPTVVLDRDLALDLDDTPTDRVLFDHRPGMKQLVQELAALGHTRMALVVTQSPNRPMRGRIEGFRAGHKASGLALDDALLVRLPSATSSAFEAVKQLLQRPARPTALIVMGTNILSETLNAISACALRIPQDVSLVAVGDPDFAANHVPPISSLRVDLDEVADAACRLLLSRMRGESSEGARTVRIANRFIERASCGPAPQQGKA